MAPPGGTLAEFAYRRCYGVRMMLRRTLLAGLLVFAVASCGGDDSSSVSDMIEEASGDAGTSDAGSSDSDESGLGDYQATGNECIDAASAFGYAIASLGNAMTGADWDLEEFRRNMDIARSAIADSAKADFDTVADAYDALAEVMSEVNAAGGIQTAEGQEILTNANNDFDDAEIDAAAGRLTVYYSTECMEYYGLE